ncbi:MAG: nitroreductase family protein [Acidimicrobiales bacterium]|nr:nitroreductase family protein [Acidimicrobiales bacterium]
MATYEHPYPDPELAAAHPFTPYDVAARSDDEMRARAGEFHELMDARRSVRMFDDRPVPRDLIETAIRTASTAPSGAHMQPWTFVAVSDPDLKRRIRSAAEEEERTNYLENRMNAEWQAALAPLGTDHHKEFLEIAPWLVVLFEQRFGEHDDGSKKTHYYVKESVGIAAGMFVTAIHQMGLATLPHTPSPMAFLRAVLDRPETERPFVLFPVGHPLPGVQVPDLERKPLDQVALFRE